MVQKVEIPNAKKATKTVSDEQQTTSKTIPTPTSPSPSSSATSISAEQRHRMIAEAAYLIAEQRDFKGEAALDDWRQAEAEVDRRIASSN